MPYVRLHVREHADVVFLEFQSMLQLSVCVGGKYSI